MRGPMQMPDWLKRGLGDLALVLGLLAGLVVGLPLLVWIVTAN
jgi:hypothetical protein